MLDLHLLIGLVFGWLAGMFTAAGIVAVLAQVEARRAKRGFYEHLHKAYPYLFRWGR